tara:strand:+ start:136 stop:276 length:141 start_codon:yes stop_codon:yes gene_type:complete
VDDLEDKKLLLTLAPIPLAVISILLGTFTVAPWVIKPIRSRLKKKK